MPCSPRFSLAVRSLCFPLPAFQMQTSGREASTRPSPGRPLDFSQTYRLMSALSSILEFVFRILWYIMATSTGYPIRGPYRNGCEGSSGYPSLLCIVGRRARGSGPSRGPCGVKAACLRIPSPRSFRSSLTKRRQEDLSYNFRCPSKTPRAYSHPCP